MLVLTIGAPSVYATSGFDRGVHDAKTQDTRQWYILQPHQGFAFHSKQFVHDYIQGFCSISPGTSSDADEASWNACDPDSGSWVSTK